MKLMNQPLNGQLGNDLIDLLDSPDYDTLNIVVAFAKNSGVLRIKDSLDKFRRRGGTVNAFLGVDLGVTSYEALTALLLCTDTLSVVHSEKSQTFHPKIYQFIGKEKGIYFELKQPETFEKNSITLIFFFQYTRSCASSSSSITLLH